MTVRALRWRRLVEQHIRSIHRALVGVARRAGHILVSTLKGEAGLLMIEQRWPPLVRVVARLALLRACAELIRMRILVAAVALRRGCAELHVQHGPFQVRRPMAIGARHRPVRSNQRKARRVVIEAAHIAPLLR